MWPFKKKKIYKITWHYIAYYHNRQIIDLVQGRNVAEAWQYIEKRERPYNISLDCIEEVSENDD